MNRAAIYTRVSTQMQAEEGFSLEAQETILTDVMERKELQLYRVYSDPGISGGSLKRPGVQALITDMKAGRFDTILIHKLDRLSRNLGDLYSFIDMINKYNVRLIIAAQGSEEIDTRSPMGKAFLFFSGIWAQIYLENLREETLKGLTTKAKNGGRHMSKPPLGYTFHDRDEDGYLKLIIVEEEALLVREVFNLYIKGQGRTKIAHHMNTISRLKEGAKWDAKAVKTIITNWTYAGYNHFKPEDWPEEKRIISKGNHEAIVSQKDFEEVNKLLHRKKKSEASRSSHMYAFSGILKCGKCGSNYAGTRTSLRSNGVRYKGYRCIHNYLHKTCDASSIQENIITELLFQKLNFINDNVQEKPKPLKKEIVDLKKEVEKSNLRRKNWMLALGDGNLLSVDYAMLIDEEDARMKKVYAKLKEETEIIEPEIPIDELINVMIGIRENWNLLEEETQKELIQSLFKKIEINKNQDDKWEITELLTV
ncbi:recombinase family protein [Paenibacillus algorifonticola]|uniref:recombinase family protein n=1 Tax=Paenibacillus algorifonticola TaxID=684063 RepID=UPI003D2C0436